MQYTCCYFVMLGLTVGGMLGKLLWWLYRALWQVWNSFVSQIASSLD